MRKTLLLGYGNPDRQDDGIAWHLLVAVAQRVKYPLPQSWEEGLQASRSHPDLELDFSLQLVPEMAEKIAGFERVCFLDAHTGRVPEEVHFEPISSQLQKSPFTHHMTPATLVYLINSLYHVQPEAALLSIRGYEFGFSHVLSPQTHLLLEPAQAVLFRWLYE